MPSNILRRTSFHRQLSITVTAAILGLALFSSMITSWEASKRMRGYLVEQGQRIADNLARQSTLALLIHAPENAREAVAATLAFPDVMRVEIIDAAGVVLLAQQRQDVSSVVGDKKPGDQAQAVQPRLEGETEKEWIFVAPVVSGPAESSPFDITEVSAEHLGQVRVVLSKETHDRLIASLLAANLAITLSFAVLLLIVLRVLTRRLTKPLQNLSGLMRRAESGESGLRATPSGPSDIITMAQAFNKMMQVLEEREAELTLSRDEALRTAMLKAQFATTVSHEVRTPLNGVVGMLDMLKEMELSPQQREYVEVAWSSAHTLITLINDILDFSKMEAGKLNLESIDFDLRQLIEESLDLLASQAQAKGLELGYVFDGDVPARVCGDPLRLRQVLVNLVGNAVKFTNQGEVAIRVGLISRTERALSLRIEVADTGIGISPEGQRHLFESFSQADRSTTRKYGGTGLGLAICKQLVELMGGEIGINSQIGVGSTFWFSLACTVGQVLPSSLSAERFQGRRVLVVDESEIVRRFLEQNLMAYGMRCHATVNGPEAVAELARAAADLRPYDLIIMDNGVVDASGIDLARSVRASDDAAGVRILVLKRFGNNGDAGSLGADSYLGKPLRLDRLLEAIERLFAVDAPVSSTREASGGKAPSTASRHKLSDACVLVAEDNRTNQLVANGMLNMLGCRCEFADDGTMAVELARRQRFDLILMDCNMPEMDGYEATAHIRNFEEPLGRRTPILAMTANTQPGDAEKCLSAGMDDYLPKPITLAELRLKLERWLLVDADNETAGEIQRPAEKAPEANGALDPEIFDKLKEILGPTLEQAILPYLEDTPAHIRRIEEGIAVADHEVVRKAAHVIKGSSSNLGASVLAQVAKSIEDLARAENCGAAGEFLPQLHESYRLVAEALQVATDAGSRDSVDAEETVALVLVVDDDRSTRAALRYTLQRDGFRVEEAGDGAEALSVLKRTQPDVILMDAVMPVMDGFTACAKVQELPNGKNIPVLMITALEDNTSVERAFAAGASDYIPKPIHFAVLSQRVRRIIEATRAEKHIRHLAYNDLLTSLPNRTLFIDQLSRRIEHARQNGESLAVLFLDLDRFKYVNDSLGHDIGDRLLVAVSQRLRRSVRNADCVARLGGDEFTVLLTNISGATAAATAAQNICRALAAPFEINGHDIFVSTSIGISLYPNNGIDVGTLLKHADTAMYRAKKSNSGFQFFEEAMEHSISEHVRLENDLRRALERKELETYFQPQARMDTGEIIGMEALLRWNHPVRGMVSPADFIPLAEENGLILPIGEWVLRDACKRLQGWRQEGLGDISVAVNLSGRQLMHQDFAATVEKILASTGLPPHLLELEITESTLMEHAADTLEVLTRLRALGVRLSIDDFGTGYSSLAYLKRFPVNLVKIDRSFVKDLPMDADDAAIVTGIIALAHSLRLKVIAEGVETAEQRDFLQGKACDLLQGFYLGRPMPAEQFRELVSKSGRISVAAGKSSHA